MKKLNPISRIYWNKWLRKRTKVLEEKMIESLGKPYCRETGKIPYKSEAHALKWARKIKKKGVIVSNLNAYKCEHCGKWHLGHRRENGSQTI